MWRFHVSLAVAVTLILVIGRVVTYASIIPCILAFAALSTVMTAALSQVFFKAGERSLVVGPKGLSTHIGKKGGSIAWGEVRSVDSEGDDLVILGRGGNAMMVPSSAFASEVERNECVTACKRWIRDAQSNNS